MSHHTFRIKYKKWVASLEPKNKKLFLSYKLVKNKKKLVTSQYGKAINNLS